MRKVWVKCASRSSPILFNLYVILRTSVYTNNKRRKPWDFQLINIRLLWFLILKAVYLISKLQFMFSDSVSINNWDNHSEGVTQTIGWNSDTFGTLQSSHLLYMFCKDFKRSAIIRFEVLFAIVLWKVFY